MAERPDDPGLSTDGMVQAQELAQRLQLDPIDHIFASPFLRTVQTAHSVAEQLHLSVKLEAGLGEYIQPRKFHGFPQLLSKTELRQQFPCLDLEYCDRISPNYPETRPELLARTRRTINILLQEFSGNLLLVSHAASIKGLALALNPKASRWDAPLCGITKLVQQGDRWQLELQRDASHISHPPNRITDFLKYWRHRIASGRSTSAPFS